ncbi:MAG: hypothetical protein NUV48_07275 [Peptococcaceae bacterium]|jgi:hypothetical protein|nr:hypothetical protein [Peptococcaceae bacterium]
MVSNHAITQYAKKMFLGKEVSRETIRQILAEIVVKGQRVCQRPSRDGCSNFEVKYKGLSVNASFEPDRVIVVTFLGDRTYRGWAREKEIKPRYPKSIRISEHNRYSRKQYNRKSNTA